MTLKQVQGDENRCYFNIIWTLNIFLRLKQQNEPRVLSYIF